VGGFSLHAGVAVRANQRNKRERLCRYIARPALSEQRLSLTAAGKVRGPRVNLTRYHGVFAPGAGDHSRAGQGAACASV
jgi:hypothetical protein